MNFPLKIYVLLNTIKKVGTVLYNRVRFHPEVVLVHAVMFLLLVGCVCALLHRLGCFPSVLGYAKNAESVNEVMYNLSYSFMAGVIFYVINDWVPSHIHEYQAKQALCTRINDMKGGIDCICSFIKYLECCQDCGNIDDVKAFHKSIWVKYCNANNELIIQNVNVDDVLAVNAKIVLDSAQSIIDSPFFCYLNKSVANTVAKIIDNEFLRSCTNRVDVRPSYDNLVFLNSQLEDRMYIAVNKVDYKTPTVLEKVNEEVKSIKK